jgi:hypothetical protein
MVKVKFEDGSEIEEAEALDFGYAVGKYGDMTVALVGADPAVILSVHHRVRSCWKVGAPAEPTIAFDISSIPKKTK